MKRVVVSGIGVISSLGHGRAKFWKNLLLGKSGICHITSFDTTSFPSHFGGIIRDFNAHSYMDSKSIPNYGRATQFAIAAAKLALEDVTGTVISSKALKNIDVVVGTTMGETQLIEAIDDAWVNQGERQVLKQWISQYPGNALAMGVAKELELEGRCIVIPTACSAGNYAVGYGYDLIRLGRSSLVLAGGADAFSKIAFTGFNRLYAMAPEMCSPFDKNRKGMLLGEGSGFVLLETLESAQNRGATIYAEILGYGLSCDANHMTIPTESGLSQVMLTALNQANIDVSRVDYISAHGTGTTTNDKVESKAINRVFGDKNTNVAVSSIKSMLGHTMGAASVLEAITCSLAIYSNEIPPTINYQTPDEECHIDCVPNYSRKKKVNIAINNSFAFGGNNACVVFKKTGND